jgi:NAD-dependent SIR2 family protein deacetylase
MFRRNEITECTGTYRENVLRLKNAIINSDAIIIGAGAGLSTAAGMTYSGKRFKENFADFEEKYGFHDMYSGGFYPFGTVEEYWAYWSRFIYVNRYEQHVNDTYDRLFQLVEGRDYFVITTNVDHMFQKSGFDKQRLFYTQGDYGLFQCSEPCHNATYDNEETILEMVRMQKNMKIPGDLIPFCPVCGKPMTMNLRSDDKFVQDSGWNAARNRYSEFLGTHSDKRVLFLELGVGFNTPIIIKYPFHRMAEENTKSVYACVNNGEAFCPSEIAARSVCINEDIHKVFEDIYNV